MDLIITGNELVALSGLSHIQQLAYLRGIKPFMDVKTGLVGIKRGISYQSIAEELYIEPHPGIKSVKFSRAQVIRAVDGLVRAGLVTIESQEKQLILKCLLASKPYSVQNKAVINPSRQAVIDASLQPDENKELNKGVSQKPVTPETPKAVTPLINNNYYLYLLLQQFEKFFALYPEKKSKPAAWEAFQALNPSPALFDKIMQALQMQIEHRAIMQQQGLWVPAWKFPANWLSQKNFNDELSMPSVGDKQHEAHRKCPKNNPPKDIFFPKGFEQWLESEPESSDHNVVYLTWKG